MAAALVLLGAVAAYAVVALALHAPLFLPLIVAWLLLRREG